MRWSFCLSPWLVEKKGADATRQDQRDGTAAIIAFTAGKAGLSHYLLAQEKRQAARKRKEKEEEKKKKAAAAATMVARMRETE